MCCFPVGCVNTRQYRSAAVTLTSAEIFNMATKDERPVHEVCLDGFWIGKYEVTQRQWQAVMGNNPSRFKYGNDFPVEQVSWNDAKQFVNRLNNKTGFQFALPTEAQWEYTARSGGRKENYAGGDEVHNVAWYRSNSDGKTHRVGNKARMDLVSMT